MLLLMTFSPPPTISGAGEQWPAGTLQCGLPQIAGPGPGASRGQRLKWLHPPGAALLGCRETATPRGRQQAGQRDPAGNGVTGRLTGSLLQMEFPTDLRTWWSRKHLQAQQAYESRVSSLVRGMSRLEQKLHDIKEENAALLSDQASIRELCIKLDSDKELKARQLSLKSMDLERVSQPIKASARLTHIIFKPFWHKCALLGDRGAGRAALWGGPAQETARQREADHL